MMYPKKCAVVASLFCWAAAAGSRMRKTEIALAEEELAEANPEFTNDHNATILCSAFTEEFADIFCGNGHYRNRLGLE
jgi:hypothetical protein